MIFMKVRRSVFDMKYAPIVSFFSQILLDNGGRQQFRTSANPTMKSSSTFETKVIRVLIADDHPVVREGLATILKSDKDITTDHRDDNL